jgi:hypothetical protein
LSSAYPMSLFHHQPAVAFHANRQAHEEQNQALKGGSKLGSLNTKHQVQVSINVGTPKISKNGWFIKLIMENPSINGWELGVPPFQETCMSNWALGDGMVKHPKNLNLKTYPERSRQTDLQLKFQWPGGWHW